MSPNEDKLIAQRNKGVNVSRELRELGSAFDEVKAELTRAWMATAPRDEAGREKLWLATTLVSRAHSIMLQHHDHGKIAEVELEAIRKAGEKKKLLGIIPA